MRSSQKIVATVLIVLLGAAIYGIGLLGRRPKVSTKRKAAAAAAARLESDEDEVDDATQDLNRAGGGKKQRIEQLEEEHKAVSAEVDNAVPKYPNPLPDQFGLVHQYKQWSWLEQKLQGLTQARRAA